MEVALGALSENLSSPGLGAWTFFYEYGWKPTTDRQKAGLRAVKRALIDNGYGKGIDVDMLIFGDAVRNRAVEFQRANGIGADGVVGPKTMRKLLALYIMRAENDHGLPDHVLGQLCYGESNNDPIAEGVIDKDDEGVLQFHLPFWPHVTLLQAWDPKFEIDMGAQKLANLKTQTGSWKGAIAAWNIGATYAKAWVLDGYPASGGPSMGLDPLGQPIDSYARATAYYGYVTSLPF